MCILLYNSQFCYNFVYLYAGLIIYSTKKDTFESKQTLTLIHLPLTLYLLTPPIHERIHTLWISTYTQNHQHKHARNRSKIISTVIAANEANDSSAAIVYQWRGKSTQTTLGLWFNFNGIIIMMIVGGIFKIASVIQSVGRIKWIMPYLANNTVRTGAWAQAHRLIHIYIYIFIFGIKCIFADLRALKLDISTMAMELWWQLKSAWESFQHLLFAPTWVWGLGCTRGKNKVFFFGNHSFACGSGGDGDGGGHRTFATEKRDTCLFLFAFSCALFLCTFVLLTEYHSLSIWSGAAVFGRCERVNKCELHIE